MKRYFRGAEGILCIALIVVLLAALSGAVWVSIQMDQLPAFHDLTIELGQELPPVQQFLTEYGDAESACLVTPMADIDLTRVGSQRLTFRQNGTEEEVTLTIRDTTAPAVAFRDLVLALGNRPAPEDLVASVEDRSQVTVSFAEEFAAPDNYGSVSVAVQVADASGNTTTGTCTVNYVWLRETVTVELGDVLEIGDLLMRPEDASVFTDQTAVDEINASGLGTYTVTGSHAGMTCQCIVTVRDTAAPALELKSLLLELGDTAEAMDFAVLAQDLSGAVAVQFVQEPDLKLLGTQTVTVEARDSSGNVTLAEATLEIREDIQPPVIQGAEDMRVEIGSAPDYDLGVVAADNKDGYVEFTYDASQEDTSKSGSYYVIYTAVDKAGNKTVVRRKIIVDHDQSDIDAMVAEIVAELEDDPMACFDWMQDHVWYSNNWGDGDPVWYGLTKRTGNCYVHAYCLQALLEAKGYETQIIWTTDKSHYWVILDTGNGVWRHLDSTPGEIHSRYGLMDDWQRKYTLSNNRDWDRDAWPKCESE